MNKTAKASKTVRANKRKAKLKAKHSPPACASDRVTNPQLPISLRPAGQIVGTHNALGIGRRQPGAGN
jgi:hypothetical protein